MLSIFPIQFLAPLAYFILRLCVGSICLYLGIERFKNRSQSVRLFTGVALLECTAGLLFILGAYTQIAALAVLVLSTVHIFRPRTLNYPGSPRRLFSVLLFSTALSLFITGAGILAFDLPI